jgi:hypothetical protein
MFIDWIVLHQLDLFQLSARTDATPCAIDQRANGAAGGRNRDIRSGSSKMFRYQTARRQSSVKSGDFSSILVLSDSFIFDKIFSSLTKSWPTLKLNRRHTFSRVKT